MKYMSRYLLIAFLLGVDLIGIGSYLMLYTLRLIVLRNIGYSRVFDLINTAMYTLPFVSFFAIIIFGVLYSKNLFLKFVAVMLSFIPIACYCLSYSVTYSNQVGKVSFVLMSLTKNELAVLIIGSLMMFSGILLIAITTRKRRLSTFSERVDIK